MSKKLVISALACVAMVATFASASDATRTLERQVQPDRTGLVRPDIPGQVAEALSQGLAMHGLEVYRDGYSLTIFTKEGQVVDLELPSTLDGLKRGEFTVYRNGKLVMIGESRPARPHIGGGGNDFDLPECLFVATNIFALQTQICVNLNDNELNLYCLVEAAAGLPLNTLKCTFVD